MKKERLIKIIIGAAGILGACAFGISAYAFTDNASTPPANDAYAALTVGSGAQDKHASNNSATLEADNMISDFWTYLAPLGGNVGIGTTSPNVKLHVQGPVWLDPLGTNGNSGGLNLQNGAIFSGSTKDYGLQVFSNNKLLLNPNGGNVGVGNASPNYKLDITGTANATQFCLSGSCISSWPSSSGGTIGGSGSANYLARFTSPTTLGTGSIQDNGAGTVTVPSGSWTFNTPNTNYMVYTASVPSFGFAQFSLKGGTLIADNISAGTGGSPNGTVAANNIQTTYINSNGATVFANGNIYAQGGLTLGGVTQYSWPSGGYGPYSTPTFTDVNVGDVINTYGGGQNYLAGTLVVGSYASINGVIYGNSALSVQGPIYGAAKYFDIPYPGDPSKRLVHASIEGPEVAVYYRGEASLVNGKATVVLPSYFESLTRTDGRTVLLTPEFTGDEPISELAAAYPTNGTFAVRAVDSQNPNQKFYWEVKAVRSDQAPLQVVREAAGDPALQSNQGK